MNNPNATVCVYATSPARQGSMEDVSWKKMTRYKINCTKTQRKKACSFFCTTIQKKVTRSIVRCDKTVPDIERKYVISF